MNPEFESIEARLQYFLIQLQSEVGVLDRIVHRNKNQHRRSSYFQYLSKVRRDCKLLQSTNLVELVNSCFLVINGNRPKQKVQLLESLKRRKCGGGKYNFLMRLQGVARLLSQSMKPPSAAPTGNGHQIEANKVITELIFIVRRSTNEL
ncbi:uncharacterized protein [Rutidosis leptorrhynchoides]|uniref:uncharacterized protein isoform X1 n=1 Tax=Rutidosis leptorrhynchoides TaxID=125765 RepID=UPI003A9976EF